MIDSVPDHMEQWVFEVLQDASIHLNVSAGDVQARQFVVALRDVANRTGELLEQWAHWH